MLQRFKPVGYHQRQSKPSYTRKHNILAGTEPKNSLLPLDDSCNRVSYGKEHRKWLLLINAQTWCLCRLNGYSSVLDPIVIYISCHKYFICSIRCKSYYWGNSKVNAIRRFVLHLAMLRERNFNHKIMPAIWTHHITDIFMSVVIN